MPIRGPFSISMAMVGLLLASCGGDVDVKTNPGGTVGEGRVCSVSIRYEGNTELAYGDLSLVYTRVAGTFGLPGQTRRCRHVDPAIVSSSTGNICESDCRNGEDRYLALSFFTRMDGSENLVQGPAELFRCEFRGDPSTLPELEVSGSLVGPGESTLYDSALTVSFDCEPEQETTTTTTTTLPCSGDECDALPLEIWMDDGAGIEAFDFRATFPCDAGNFVASADPTYWESQKELTCSRANEAVGLWATVEETYGAGGPGCYREVRIGIISLDGMDGPAALLICPFLAAREIDASDFEVSEDDEEPYASASIRGFSLD